MGTKALVFEIVGVDRASATFERIGAAVTQTTTKMSTMQKAGAMAGKALLIGFAGVAAGAYEATKAAGDDQAAQAQLAQQLKNNTGATKDQIDATNEWIQKQALATGVAVDQLRPAMANLATATGSVSKAQSLLSLGMDISAGKGKDLKTVTEALAKAQNGNLGGLARLGVATKDASGKTKSLSQITSELAAKYQGAAANAAGTMAGKQKILGVEFHELMVKIGTGLIPVMTQLAAVLIKVVGFISEHTTAVGIAVAALGALLAITWAVGAATKAWAAIQVIAGVASKAFAAAQWLVNAALDANPIGLVVIAIAALVAGLILAYKHSETFRNIVNAVFSEVQKIVAAAVSFIQAHWKTLLAILTGPIGAAVLVIATHWATIKVGARILLTWLSDAWQAVKSAIVNPIQNAGQAIGNVWGDIKTGFAVVRDKLTSIASDIKSALTGPFDAVKSAVNTVIGVVDNLIGKFLSLISTIKSIPHPSIPHIPGVGRLAAGAASDAAGGVAGFVHTAGRTDAGGVSTSGRKAAGGGGDVYEVHIHGVTDSVAAGREVQKVLLAFKRANGGGELGLA